MVMSISDVEVFPVEVLEARAQINRQLDIYTQFDSQTLSGGQCPKRLQ